MILIGFKGDYPYVVFENIIDFESKNNDDVITFEEDDIIYEYRKHDGHYFEIHNKGPVFDSYSVEGSEDVEDDVEPEWTGEPCGHYQAGCGTSYSSSYDSRDYSCFNTSCGGGYPSRSYGGCGGGC